MCLGIQEQSRDSSTSLGLTGDEDATVSRKEILLPWPALHPNYNHGFEQITAGFSVQNFP